MATSISSKIGLVINTMSRDIYNQISSGQEGGLQEDQLYLVDDEVFDAFGKRIVNADDPVLQTDVPNLRWLSDNYVGRQDISSYVDPTKLWSSDGQKYTDSSLAEHKLAFTQWQVAVLSGSFSPSEVEVVWNPSTSQGTLNGWNLLVRGNRLPTGVYSDAAVEIRTEDDSPALGHYDISCARQQTSEQTDACVRSNELFSCLSSLSANSTCNDILSALLKLKAAASWRS